MRISFNTYFLNMSLGKNKESLFVQEFIDNDLKIFS